MQRRGPHIKLCTLVSVHACAQPTYNRSIIIIVYHTCAPYSLLVIPDKNTNLNISVSLRLFSVSPAFFDPNDSCFSKIRPAEANLQALIWKHFSDTL